MLDVIKWQVLVKKNEEGLYVDSRFLGCNVKFVKSLGGNICNIYDICLKKYVIYNIVQCIFVNNYVCII